MEASYLAPGDWGAMQGYKGPLGAMWQCGTLVFLEQVAPLGDGDGCFPPTLL